MVFLRRQPEPVHAFNEQQHTIAPVSPEIATLAATLGVRHKLAMADALIYATALSHHAPSGLRTPISKASPMSAIFPNPSAESGLPPIAASVGIMREFAWGGRWIPRMIR